MSRASPVHTALRSCTGDEGGPFGFGDQVTDLKPPRAEVMQRIAVPMIGGMVSSTVLTLVVIPAVYALIKGMGLRRHG